MQKWRNRRRRTTKTAPEDAAQQPPPLRPEYPGMGGDADVTSAEQTPTEAADAMPVGETVEVNVEAEVQPDEVMPSGTPPPKRRRRRSPKDRPAKAPDAPIIEPGTATGEAAEVSIPELPEEPPPAEIAKEEPETEPAPIAAAEAKPTKKPKGAVVLAIGLPGSGKSTWFKRHGIQPLSSDLLRHLLFDNVQEQRHQDLVFSTLRSLLRARMIARMPWNHVDATNLSPKERRHWIRMAQDFGYEVHAVYFDVPLEVCMERNRKRHRVVPDDVMQRMSAKLRPPTFDEGFSKITVVRVKQRTEA